jgi:hypothetical protein
MKEQELIDLGFEKRFGDTDELGWYYFKYDFGRGLSLISNASDEVADDKQWFVEVFEEEKIRFTDATEMAGLINLIEKNTFKS